MLDYVRFREMRTTDNQGIAVLVNRAYPDEPEVSAETIAWSRGRADPLRPQANELAELNGAVIGTGFLRGVPAMPGLLLNVEVDPDHRRKGIGSRLAADVLAAAGPTELTIWTIVGEKDSGSLAFVAGLGFTERDRMFESALNLATFEPDAFSEVHAAAERGIRFTTLTAEDSAQLRRQLHALTTELHRDVPSREALLPSTYEEWVRDWLEAPHARPDLLAIAMEGDRPVALSSVSVTPDGIAFNQMTGVVASHRGRGLGLAIKVHALRLVKDAGLAEIRTDNHSRNARMLAVNARLGYRRLPGFIELSRT